MSAPLIQPTGDGPTDDISQVRQCELVAQRAPAIHAHAGDSIMQDKDMIGPREDTCRVQDRLVITQCASASKSQTRDGIVQVDTTEPRGHPHPVDAAANQAPTLSPQVWDLSVVSVTFPPRDHRLVNKRSLAYTKRDYRYVCAMVDVLMERERMGLTFSKEDLRFMQVVRQRLRREIELYLFLRRCRKKLRAKHKQQ